MIMGGRRFREAEERRKRLVPETGTYSPHMPALARVIMNSRAFQRLMERLDTREGVTPVEYPPFQEPAPAPSRSSERLLPEKGPFFPRMHPLGGMVFRTRFVQRLLNPSLPSRSTSGEDRGAVTLSDDRDDEASEERLPGSNEDLGRQFDGRPAGSSPVSGSVETEIRELRQKALIASLLHSASRWGGR